MKISFSILHSIIVAVFFPVAGLLASPASDDEGTAERQVVSGVSLPFWGEGECRENFEVRIWPHSVLIWLEEENLRAIIADPATPEAERQSLKRLLALQRAWRVHS